MIFVGIDDTDMPDTPGTNKLAFHLSDELAAEYATQWIVRFQLLVDPRVPCTNKNGCVAMLLKPHEALEADVSHEQPAHIGRLIDRLRRTIIEWSPAGSDPGLCVTETVPGEIIGWGRAAQTELLEQSAAVRLAADARIHLEPLGGTGGGIIGALAAVGLLATWNGGRIVHCGAFAPQAFHASGVYEIEDVYEWGVQEVLSLADGARVTRGAINLGKRLRPNLRDGRAVLYVLPGTPDDSADWMAQRIVD